MFKFSKTSENTKSANDVKQSVSNMAESVGKSTSNLLGIGEPTVQENNYQQKILEQSFTENKEKKLGITTGSVKKYEDVKNIKTTNKCIVGITCADGKIIKNHINNVLTNADANFKNKIKALLDNNKSSLEIKDEVNKYFDDRTNEINQIITLSDPIKCHVNIKGGVVGKSKPRPGYITQIKHTTSQFTVIYNHENEDNNISLEMMKQNPKTKIRDISISDLCIGGNDIFGDAFKCDIN